MAGVSEVVAQANALRWLPSRAEPGCLNDALPPRSNNIWAKAAAGSPGINIARAQQSRWTVDRHPERDYNASRRG